MIKVNKLAEENVTISKSTYKTLLVAVVAVLMITSFMGGFIIGGTGKATTTTGQAVAQPTQQQPEQLPSRVDISTDDDPSVGDPNAPVTIIEFSDFECPFCSRFYAQSLPQIEQNYISTGKVRLVYRDFPLSSIHPSAQKAAEAGECANEQGKFWEYHDWLFDNQGAWAGLGEAGSVTKFKEAASTLNLDTAKFNSCIDTAKYASEVQKDFQDGANAGVSGTPAFFINGQLVVGAQPYSVFQQIIDAELAS